MNLNYVEPEWAPSIERMTEELRLRGWTYFSEYLGAELLRALRAEALALYEEDQFRRARIGPTDEELLRGDIRRDSIFWLDPNTASPIQRKLFLVIEALMAELGRRMFISLQSFEAHYAVYPGGGFYKKHLDQFQADCLRQLSFVIFLNEIWNPEDGGQLRIYQERDPESVEVEINPEIGKAVLFLSSSVYHEVLPTTKTRMSLAGWMKKEVFVPGPIVE